MPVKPADMRAINFSCGATSSSGASSLKSERVMIAVASCPNAARTLEVLGGTISTEKSSTGLQQGDALRREVSGDHNTSLAQAKKPSVWNSANTRQ